MDSMTLVSTALQEVIPGLWIGDYQAARDARLLKANKITAVVSASTSFRAMPGVERDLGRRRGLYQGSAAAQVLLREQ